MINSGIKSIESKVNNFKIFPVTKLTDKNRNSDARINTMNNNENYSPNEFANVLKINNNMFTKKEKPKQATNIISAKSSDLNTEKKIYKTSSLTHFSNKVEKKTAIQRKIKADLERVKISHKSYGVIEAYSAITTEGIYRYCLHFLIFIENIMKIEYLSYSTYLNPADLRKVTIINGLNVPFSEFTTVTEAVVVQTF